MDEITIHHGTKDQSNFISRWALRRTGRCAGSLKAAIAKFLEEDEAIRNTINEKIALAGVAAIEIERTQGNLRVFIKAARPGLIIGRGGKGMEDLNKAIADALQKVRARRAPVALSVERGRVEAFGSFRGLCRPADRVGPGEAHAVPPDDEEIFGADHAEPRRERREDLHGAGSTATRSRAASSFHKGRFRCRRFAPTLITAPRPRSRPTARSASVCGYIKERFSKRRKQEEEESERARSPSRDAPSLQLLILLIPCFFLRK